MPSEFQPAAPADGTSGEPAGPASGAQFLYPGIVTGLLLILLGIASQNFSLIGLVGASLLLYAGVSIILGAFGSTAVVEARAKGFTIAGVAGITLILLWAFNPFDDSRYMLLRVHAGEQPFKISLLRGDGQGGVKGFMGAPSDELPGAATFAIFGSKLPDPLLFLEIEDENQRETLFGCIPATAVSANLGTGRTLVWHVRWPEAASESEETGLALPSIYDYNNQTLIADRPGPCGVTVGIDREQVPGSDTSLAGGWLWDTAMQLASAVATLPAAFAQTDTETDIVDTPKRARDLFVDLNSTFSHVRRQARNDLSVLGLEGLQPMLALLATEAETYRERLGLIVALTEMMRENKDHRLEMIDLITEADLDRLLDASADEDRTVRIYASEFLYDLGDPRIIDLAPKWIKTASINGRYNLILVLKGAAPQLEPGSAEATALVDYLTSLKQSNTPKTNALIDTAIALAPVR